MPDQPEPVTGPRTISRILQTQVPLSSRIVITMKTTGRQIAGCLIEIGLHHATLSVNGGAAVTVVLDDVSMFEVAHDHGAAALPLEPGTKPPSEAWSPYH